MNEGKTLIVTAGHGEPFRFWASRLVNHINTMADKTPGAVRAYDMSDDIKWEDIKYVMMCKLYAWRLVPADVERIMWIDTDCYTTRAIMDAELPWEPFSAVVDPWALKLAADNIPMPGKRKTLMQLPGYFNAGVYIATRQAIPVYEAALAAGPCMFTKRPSPACEQDLTNYMVWQALGHGTEAGWNALGEEWNTMWDFPVNPKTVPIVMHLAGMDTSRRSQILDEFFSGQMQSSTR